ncbi:MULTISPECIES: multiple monosaccharide ABC transporter substrate-binding protein [unclassified Streptomyces]|uniref:multiple monosaccharide ABC transporter substrate-binding protein n=1 Tax=unclassified Streptomyces TaxID=2593676 RepID=UPI002DD7C32C|nr:MULTISPECIES: multiple monosaccharide ABC transporter substrate-binding protein [unclassified Streptomyces]WSA95930.1 sugar ABC transporter substrate-binding protein [Streptomyces sp. NBC_01795]WSB80345.1 sugar ABC transporter substrate-binding protein [Streptomyces sp. NBC_01775]WSS11444.1 sugar ABC transporter substrate-binding protein [Streptomyces sp. NBC_01186]WSS40158.1 sugar ABC transporter substrate-binding protein [Streptomyces sp. NBC_01187]
MRNPPRTRGVRIAACAALAVTLTAALAGCGQEARGGSRYQPEKGKGGTIGVAMPTKSSERWIADGKNMVKQFKKAGYKTDLQYGDDKVENQVAQIENMITKGHRLLVIAAVDGSALTDVLKQAQDAGVRVISYDRLILGTKNVDYYASFDNERVGELQGQYILDRLKLKKPDDKADESHTIELFAGSPDDNNTKYFWNGAMKKLKPYMKSGQLVVRSKQTKMNQATTLRWDGGTAQKRMDDLISKSYGNTDVDAVLSPYDGISIGIISALKSAGYGSKRHPLPVVTGQDAELASVKSIVSGEQTQTVFKDTRKLAKQAVQMGDAVLTGKKPEVNNTTDYDNGKKVVPAYLLKPVSVDKKNTQLLVDEGYFTAGQLK